MAWGPTRGDQGGVTQEQSVENAQYIAAASPDVVRELVARVLKAEANADHWKKAAIEIADTAKRERSDDGNAQRIVRDLAEYGRRYEGSSLPCQMCSGIWGDHQEACAYRRAVESKP